MTIPIEAIDFNGGGTCTLIEDIHLPLGSIMQDAGYRGENKIK